MATEVGGSSRGRELRSWWTVGGGKGRERGGEEWRGGMKEG